MAKHILLAATLVVGSTATFAGDMAKIMVQDPYARASSSLSKSGAAFMEIMNHGPADRLIAARSEAAKRVELHTHLMDDGIARMVEVEEGFELPTDGMLALERGGAHVMLMGLVAPLEQGDEIEITLVFEEAGDVVVTVPVDLERKADHGMSHGDHSGHNHGAATN